MKLLLIVNPVSGGVDKDPFVEEARAWSHRYGIDLEVFRTSGKNDEEDLASALEEFQPDRTAAVGGDGTVLFAALAVRDRDIPMGIIPMGSANGLATELGVAEDPMLALADVVLSEVVEGLDLLVVNDEHFSLHLGDVGVNANIVAAYEEDANRGMATYAKYFVEELREMEPFSVTVEANDETHEQEAVMVGLCNSRKYGTGIPINTVGSPMDGKFEVVIVKNIDLMTLVRSGLSKFDERYFDSQNSEVIQTQSAKITFPEARQLQLDGEVIGSYETLDVRVEVGAVSLITHRDNPYL